jgi:hypothetical protein
VTALLAVLLTRYFRLIYARLASILLIMSRSLEGRSLFPQCDSVPTDFQSDHKLKQRSGFFRKLFAIGEQPKEETLMSDHSFSNNSGNQPEDHTKEESNSKLVTAQLQVYEAQERIRSGLVTVEVMTDLATAVDNLIDVYIEDVRPNGTERK